MLLLKFRQINTMQINRILKKKKKKNIGKKKPDNRRKKIPGTSSIVTTIVFNTRIGEIENKTPGTSGLLPTANHKQKLEKLTKYLMQVF